MCQFQEWNLKQGFNLGKAAEITRDELKFTKFVQRLRKRFTQVFSDILKTQLGFKRYCHN